MWGLLTESKYTPRLTASQHPAYLYKESSLDKCRLLVDYLSDFIVQAA